MSDIQISQLTSAPNFDATRLWAALEKQQRQIELLTKRIEELEGRSLSTPATSIASPLAQDAQVTQDEETITKGSEESSTYPVAGQLGIPPDNPSAGEDIGETFESNIASEWAPAEASGWGEPVNNVVPAVPNEQSTSNSTADFKPNLCKWGENCRWRSKCRYEHPNQVFQHAASPDFVQGSNATIPNPRSTPDSQRQSRGSTKSKAECRYGEGCTRKACWFTHPWDNAPPDTPEPTFSQEAPFPDNQDSAISSGDNNPIAYEDERETVHQDSSTNGWAPVDPSQNWESWDMKPSNDWGVPADNSWGEPTYNGWSAPTESDQPSSEKGKGKPSSKNTDKQKKQRNDSASSTIGTPHTQAEPTRTISTAGAEIVDPHSDPPLDAVVLDSADTPTIDEMPVAARAEAGEGASDADTVVDALSTPSLEERNSSTPSLGSEPETPSAPFSWGDEPLVNTAPEDDQGVEEAVEDQSFDDRFSEQIAPSNMYMSWAPAETSGWGDEVPAASSQGTGRSNSSKPAQGKSNKRAPKAGAQAQTEKVIISDASQSETSVPASNPLPPSEPEPEPVPQGVPEEEIPDWLLPQADPYDALNLSRPTTPVSAPAPPNPVPAEQRISSMHPASFPTLVLSPGYQPPRNSVATGPTIQPARRKGWTPIPSSSTTSAPLPTVQSSSSSPGKGSRHYRKHNQKKK